MTRSKRFVLCILLLIASAWPAFGSGGGECDDLACAYFFSPAILQTPLDSPLFRSQGRIYTRHLTAQMQVVNMKEWAEYFGRAIPEEPLSNLLYEMSIADVNALTDSIAGGQTALSQRAAALKAAFVKYGKKERVLAGLRYLSLAKRVEPLALKDLEAEWVFPPRPKPVFTTDPQQLITEAGAAIPEVDRFLADRYRFQVLRLLFYTGQFAEAQQYYEKFGSGFKDETSVKYRSMELAGGAYYKQKQFGRANYLFSLVFDKFPQLKASAYLSFHPMEDADWKETLKLARNAREREVLWQLLGIYADGISAIDNIYAMNRRSTLLPLLLTREVNIAEEHWTSNQYRGPGASGPRPDPEVVGPKRLIRIKAIADEGRAYKPHLWLLAAGHLLALAGDTAQAEIYLQRATKAMPDVPDIRAQARASLLFARVRAIKAIDKSAEPYLATEFEWLQRYIKDEKRSEAGNINRWTLQYLSDVYRNGGDRIRSLMLNDPFPRDIYQSAAVVDEILDFMHTARTEFDRFLVRNYAQSEADIQEIRAIHFAYAGDFEKAVERFRLAGGLPETNPLDADPFTIHIKDCHDCDESAPHTSYSKVSFAERMQTLWRTSQGRDQAAAEASFELANGFYNMSYYGNGRSFFRTRFGSLWISMFRRENDSHPALSMDMAEKYYLQAADLSNDREFKAKATFMAAKTEQNRTYNAGAPEKTKNPRQYFARLKDSFSDTQYYQEIIRECGYFRAFVGQ